MSMDRTPLKTYRVDFDLLLQWRKELRCQNGRFPHAPFIAGLLGYGSPTYPLQAEGAAFLPGPSRINVTLLPARLSKKGRNFGHRVFIQCPCCCSDIPAGRIGQHFDGHVRNAKKEVGIA